MRWRRKKASPGPAPPNPPWAYRPRPASKSSGRKHSKRAYRGGSSRDSSSGSFSGWLFRYLFGLIVDTAMMFMYFLGYRDASTGSLIIMSARFFKRWLPIAFFVVLGVTCWMVVTDAHPIRTYTEFMCKPSMGNKDGKTIAYTDRRIITLAPTVGPLQENAEYDFEYRSDDPQRVIYRATPTGRPPYGYPCGLTTEDMLRLQRGGK